MDIKIEKLAPWIPVVIAAGYFLFLVMSWQAYVTNMRANNAKLDEALNRLAPIPKADDS
jgi:hypothetical protein